MRNIEKLKLFSIILIGLLLLQVIIPTLDSYSYADDLKVIGKSESVSEAEELEDVPEAEGLEYDIKKTGNKNVTNEVVNKIVYSNDEGNHKLKIKIQGDKNKIQDGDFVKLKIDEKDSEFIEFLKKDADGFELKDKNNKALGIVKIDEKEINITFQDIGDDINVGAKFEVYLNIIKYDEEKTIETKFGVKGLKDVKIEIPCNGNSGDGESVRNDKVGDDNSNDPDTLRWWVRLNNNKKEDYTGVVEVKDELGEKHTIIEESFKIELVGDKEDGEKNIYNKNNKKPDWIKSIELKEDSYEIEFERDALIAKTAIIQYNTKISQQTEENKYSNKVEVVRDDGKKHEWSEERIVTYRKSFGSAWSEKVDKGKIRIKKISESKEPLKGAEFCVNDEENECVEKLTTDQYGYAETDELVSGKYFIEEVKAPKGYVKSEVIKEIEIKEEGSEGIEVEIINVLDDDSKDDDSKEDDWKEDDWKEDDSKEDDSKEDDSKEDDSKEDDSKDDDSKNRPYVKDRDTKEKDRNKKEREIIKEEIKEEPEEVETIEIDHFELPLSKPEIQEELEFEDEIVIEKKDVPLSKPQILNNKEDIVVRKSDQKGPISILPKTGETRLAFKLIGSILILLGLLIRRKNKNNN